MSRKLFAAPGSPDLLVHFISWFRKALVGLATEVQEQGARRTGSGKPAPVREPCGARALVIIFPADLFPELAMDYRERITIEPDKRGGKPCILGLRITVYDILGHLASGMSEAEILEDCPDLEPEDNRATLAIAADFERRLVAVPSL